MWNGMYVYLTVSVIFLAGGGYHIYQQHQIHKTLKEIKVLLERK